MIIHKCDKCGKTTEQTMGDRSLNTPDGWYNIVYSGDYGRNGMRYTLCGECKAALHIPDTKPEAYIGDQLIELIGEIVADHIQDK